MSSTPPPPDLAAHTFGRHHFSPPPLPERLERPQQSTPAVLDSPEDLVQRIRDVGEW